MDLYYRAPGTLEHLAHRVAEMTGLYQQAGVEVTLKDGSAAKWAEAESVAPLSIGLGGMLRERLLRNTNWTMACVNTQHPLFWLVAQPSVQGIADLKGAQVAGLPMTTAPGTFLRILFRRNGLDLLNDCSYSPLAEEQRMERLQRGELAAAQVAAMPFGLEREGLQVLAFIGGEIPASATGIAVNGDVVAPDDPDVLRVVTATRGALARIHDDRELAVRAILDTDLSGASQEDAGQLYDRYIQPYWTRDGRPDRALAEKSLAEMARELEVAKVPSYSNVYTIP